MPDDEIKKADEFAASLLAIAAAEIGISPQALNRLRYLGKIPEAVKVGRYHVYPAEAIPAIRERLTALGYIDGETHANFETWLEAMGWSEGVRIPKKARENLYDAFKKGFLPLTWQDEAGAPYGK